MGRISPSKLPFRKTIDLGITLCITLFSLAALPAISENPDLASSCAFRSVSYSSSQFHVGYFLFPPYSANSDEGAAIGSWPDYIRKLLGHSGIPYTEAIYPAKRLASRLFSGEVDLTIVADNILLKAGEERITFLPKPLTTLTSGLASLKTSPVYSIDSLRGKKLGVNRGYSYGGLIHELMKPERQLELWPSDSELQLMKLIVGKRLEAAMIYESMLRQNHGNIDTRKLHFESLSSTDFFVTLNKHTENIEETRRVLTHNMTLIDEHSKLIACPQD